MKAPKPAAMKVMKTFKKTFKKPRKAMKAAKAAAPPSSQALVAIEKKVKSEAVFNKAFLNLLAGRKFKDLKEQEQAELVEALPIPNRSMYSAFHAAMGQNSTVPDAMKEETRRRTIHIHIEITRRREAT